MSWILNSSACDKKMWWVHDKYNWIYLYRGGARISGKGVVCTCIKVWGVRFAYFISFFLNISWKWNNFISWKWNNFVSVRPNYFIFIEYLKTGGREGDSSKPPEPPLDPLLLNSSWWKCRLLSKFLQEKKITQRSSLNKGIKVQFR